jgi:3'-phosphoadenosine 5'-phosphosulfate sulfotransferase (PAPS reductase)/FAD synthetase
MDPLRGKIISAHALVDRAIDRYVTGEGKELAGIVVMFSGGNDSTALLHMMRHRLTHAGHCNTTIGIEDTRQFVRETCSTLNISLLEVYPPVSYQELVIERGFPGPANHWKMYQRLKERGFRQIRKALVRNERARRVVFVAGRRRDESRRRTNIPQMERVGSTVWVSPLYDWTDEDMRLYRRTHEVPRNIVPDMIHMSGECLCGAFAAPGELEELRFFYPEVHREIRELERAVSAAGHPEPLCRWGWGGDYESLKDFRAGRLCSSCVARREVPAAAVAAHPLPAPRKRLIPRQPSTATA